MGFLNKNTLTNSYVTEKELVDLSPEQFLSTLVENTKAGLTVKKEQRQIYDKKLKKKILPLLMEAAKDGNTSTIIEFESSEYPFSEYLLEYFKRAGIAIISSRSVRNSNMFSIKFSWAEKVKTEIGDEEYISPF